MKPCRRWLVLASEAELQYRVLRCVAELGAEVFVAGPAQARSLAISRFCARYIEFSLDWEIAPEKTAVRLDAIARAHGIALILPSDAPTTRLLSNIGPMLRTRVFPVPDPASFDELATKDRFMQLCRRLSLPHPQGQVFAGRAELLAALEKGTLRLPAILKPVNSAGSIGVVRIDSANAREIAETIGYAPILAQDFIEGEDRSLTVFCRQGRVSSEVTYSHPDGVFAFTAEPEFSALVRALARRMKLSGVFNFDARVGRDGKVWLIECNPRFFYNMDVAMVAGLNFARPSAPGQSVQTVRDVEVCIPPALLRQMLRLRRPRAADLRMLFHWLRDPVMFALVVSGYQRRWFSRALEMFLVTRKCAAA